MGSCSLPENTLARCLRSPSIIELLTGSPAGLACGGRSGDLELCLLDRLTLRDQGCYHVTTEAGGGVAGWG